MGRRIELFLKGNADIVDPVFGVRRPSGEDWGGLNAHFRAQGWPVTARVRHETAGGLGLLTGAAVPEDVAERAALFGTFRPDLQHSRALFDGRADAVIVSLQPDIGVQRWRHRASGLDFVLHDAQSWPEAATSWRRAAFDPLPLSTAEETMALLLDLVSVLQRDREVAVLVANMTAAAPGETLHSYIGVGEFLTQRVRGFNYALVEAARQADFSILDIDRIVALGGAERLIYDRMHFTLEGCRRVAAEVARILEERGVIDPA